MVGMKGAKRKTAKSSPPQASEEVTAEAAVQQMLEGLAKTVDAALEAALQSDLPAGERLDAARILRRLTSEYASISSIMLRKGLHFAADDEAANAHRAAWLQESKDVREFLDGLPELEAELLAELGVDESKKRGYTEEAPPFSPRDTSREEMGEDFKTRVKKAKAENLARTGVSSSHQLATYKALAQSVDLLNPDVPEAEKRARAKLLVQAYERLHARRPTFNHRNNKQLLAAFSIMNKVKYRRRKAAKAAQKAALVM